MVIEQRAQAASFRFKVASLAELTGCRISAMLANIFGSLRVVFKNSRLERKVDLG